MCGHPRPARRRGICRGGGRGVGGGGGGIDALQRDVGVYRPSWDLEGGWGRHGGLGGGGGVPGVPSPALGLGMGMGIGLLMGVVMGIGIGIGMMERVMGMG